MMRASIVLCVFSWRCRHLRRAASGGRYLTCGRQWRVHNTFVDGQFDRQQRQARQRIGQSDQARVLNKDNATQWPGNSSGGRASLLHLDRCQRYYTWIDANGNVQNSFYAGAQVAGQRADYVLPNGEHSAEYIDAEAFEGKGFVRSENGSPYYTWVDEKGRMHNSQIPPRSARRASREAAPSSQIAFTEGRQIEFATSDGVARAGWRRPAERCAEGFAQGHRDDHRRSLPRPATAAASRSPRATSPNWMPTNRATRS